MRDDKLIKKGKEIRSGRNEMDKEYMCRGGNWKEGEQETGDVTLRTNMIVKL